MWSTPHLSLRTVSMTCASLAGSRPPCATDCRPTRSHAPALACVCSGETLLSAVSEASLKAATAAAAAELGRKEG